MSASKAHSVPVPQLYKEASRILKQLEGKEGSLKTLVYSSKYKNYKKIYALLHKAWNHSAEIKHLLAASRILEEQPNFNPYLAHILTAELLGKGSLSGNCKPVQVLLKYEEKLRSLAAQHLNKEEHEHESKGRCPRYVRVNTLKASVDAVQSQLAKEGWWPIDYDRDNTSYDDFLHLLETLEDYCYLIDYHIPELLVFPPNTPFWDSGLYQEGTIILQDKASCLPVFISNIKPGASVLDACAAPGNKTSQIAAAINNTGRVIASEKSFKRYKTLDQLLQQRGATCVSTVNKDFTKLAESLTEGIEHIFLDPTCSSSGTDLHRDEIVDQRLQNLAAFQINLLLHALSCPSAQEVVYSTCSVHAEENEEVVQMALSQCQEFELDDLGSKLQGWKHYGKENYEFGRCCLRTVSDVDKCHGFFVAKFIRKNINSNTSITKKHKKKKMDKTPQHDDLSKHETSDDLEYWSVKKRKKLK